MKTVTEIVNGYLSYFGIALNDESYSTAAWRIQRTIVNGNITTEEYADGGAFTQKWVDRATLFGDLPYINTHSLQMDGVNDRVDVPHATNLDFARTIPFTLSTWIKSSNTASKNYLEKQGSNIGYRLWDSGGSKVQFEFRGTGGTTDRIRIETSAATSVNNGYWHNVIVTYSGSGLASGAKIYVDGSLQGVSVLNDALLTNPNNTASLSLGSRSGGGVNFYGNIDEVSIWDAELTAAQVTELFNSGSANDLSLHSSGSLVSWWTFNNVSYPTVPDNESTNSGTMINMTPGDVETEVPRV